MGFFDPADIAAADDDPFGLPEGKRIEAVIASSEVREMGKDKEYEAWVINFKDPDSSRNSDLVLFLGGKDDEAIARNNGRIKRILKLLEVPQTQYEAVADEPSLIEGTEVIVRVFRTKEDYKRVDLVGIKKDASGPAIPNTSNK